MKQTETSGGAQKKEKKCHSLHWNILREMSNSKTNEDYLCVFVFSLVHWILNALEEKLLCYMICRIHLWMDAKRDDNFSWTMKSISSHDSICLAKKGSPPSLPIGPFLFSTQKPVETWMKIKNQINV